MSLIISSTLIYSELEMFKKKNVARSHLANIQ